MLLAYLDESSNADCYCVAALVVRDDEAIPLTQALNAVVEYAQDTYGRVKLDAELHGYPLANRTDDWSRLPDTDAAADILRRAIDAIAAHDVSVCIRGTDLDGHRKRYGTRDRSHVHGTVLAWTLERVQIRAAQLDEVALVIDDEVRGSEDTYRHALRYYQSTRTFGWKAIKA